MSLIGLDIGTNSCKAMVFRPDGTPIAQAAREYPVVVPRPGWAEQDAELVWHRALECLGQAIAAAPHDPPRALAVSAQGEAVILTDGAFRPLRTAILGMDTRTTAENVLLEERFGASALYARTGAPIHTVNTLPKLLWLHAHDPAHWAQAKHAMLYEDYILARLGHSPSVSHCLASRTQMYDLHGGTWDGVILDACGIRRDWLSPLVPSGAVVGHLSQALARELNLPGPPVLASGGHDQACAALGSGVCRPGSAMVSTGSAEVVEIVLAEARTDESLRVAGISTYRHVVPGRFLAMTLNQSAGLALRWFRDTLCPEERDAAIARGEDPYDAILRGAPDGPTDLLAMAHLAGSGTPHLDTRSRGAILGLSFATTRPEIAKAILEGLSFELRLNIDLLREAGIPIETLHAVGGGARSGLWLRLKADTCQLPLRVPAVTDAACLGAALLAGQAAGEYADADDAIAQAVRYTHTELPDPETSAVYAARYQLYRDLYSLLRPVNAALSA